MSVRPATRADAAAIADALNWMIRDTLATFNSRLRSAAEVAGWIDAGNVWAAEHEGAVLGMGRLSRFREGSGYAHTCEHTICLRPEAQERGLGRALMAAIEARARQEQCHVLVAGISGVNPQAIEFHAALGFQQVAHMPQVGRKNGQWLDLILMQKILDAGAEFRPDSAGKPG